MIFIVGNSRSGTTMLGRLLGKHSHIYTFEELHFFEQIVDSETALNRPACTDTQCTSLIERLLTSARENIFARPVHGKYSQDVKAILSSKQDRDPIGIYQATLGYETARHHKRIPCEQTPRYLFFLDEILSVFPEARIINLIRDPRDVLLSQKNKWKTYFLGTWNMPLREAVRVWLNYHPIIISRLWVSAIRQAQRFENNPAVFSIRFEDLVHRPNEIIQKVCEFLGIPFEEHMLEVEQIGSSIRRDEIGKKGIDPGRSGNWRAGGLSPFEIAVCEKIAHSEMALSGYQISGEKLSIIRYCASIVVLAFKGGLSLLMNLSRTRSLAQAVRRRL